MNYPLTLDVHFAVKDRTAAAIALTKAINLLVAAGNGEIEKDIFAEDSTYEGYVDLKYCNTTDVNKKDN